MAAQNMPAAEVEVTTELVAGLLSDQHPDLAALPLRELANGWDNVIFRLGDEYTVRVPRREMAAVLVQHEQRWLPEMARRLPIRIPAPVRAGGPADGYPWHWSVCPWFEGRIAADSALNDPAGEARRLGAFVGALHLAAPPDAPHNPFRGMPIGELTERIDRNLAALGDEVDGSAIRRLWGELVATPEWGGPPQWVHGDLHTANVLVRDGRIEAVIDFGDITGGDPAVDFAIAWMLFGPDERAAFRAAAGDIDEATWRRGEAWALHFALMYLAFSADNPLFRRMGTQLLATVTTELCPTRRRLGTVRAMDAAAVTERCDENWDGIVPVLHDYIEIPNVSQDFDPQWREHGFMAEAVELIAGWCRERPIPGLTVEVVELPERTPMIVMEIPPTGSGRADDTVLLYGHLDKQPEMEGWRDGLGPWTPVLEGDRLYGRGGADDGYAAFASLSAIEAVHAAGGSHARCIVLIEAGEESGSPDLPAYVEALADRIGSPSLVVCLDSGCIDYDRMWVTTSLRGMVSGVLTVDIVTDGLHSGDASGMVPSTFRIVRQLLDRVEDPVTGAPRLAELEVEIPADRVHEAELTAAEIGAIADHYPFVEDAEPTTHDPAGQLLARTWHTTLSVIGADGLPPTERAGNVLRPRTAVKLSFRLPPTCDEHAAAAAITEAFESHPPYGASVTFTRVETGPGWNAPAMAPWLVDALDAASTASFGQPARTFGEGGSIPFMGMLGARFPDAQFVISGVLGPDANAHGPNEYLHVPTARRLTMAVAHLLDAHATRR